jgi:phosphoribosyl 1,2-cyclic phosphodiesterase
MKITILITLLLTITLTSCSKIYSTLRKDDDTEGKTDIKSKFNDDNKIFTNDKLFTYDVHQVDAARELNFKMELLVIPGKFTGGKKIKYKLYYTDKNLTLEEHENYLDTNKLYKWDITNVMEDDKSIWIHPPRSYSLEKMQLTPFPQIDFPTKAGNNWSSRMHIAAG